jgi:hypothetical protein
MKPDLQKWRIPYNRSLGEEFIFDYPLARLCIQEAGYEPGFIERVKRWSLLDSYYTPTRYPKGIPDGISVEVYTQDAAQGVVDRASKAVDCASCLNSQSSDD